MLQSFCLESPSRNYTNLGKEYLPVPAVLYTKIIPFTLKYLFLYLYRSRTVNFNGVWEFIGRYDVLLNIKNGNFIHFP